jgi:transcriptional regulator with XRE-family HTH domain
MLLKDYLEEKNLTLKDFAELIGVTPLTVFNWAHRKTTPMKIYLRLIFDTTKGRVTNKDFVRKK